MEKLQYGNNLKPIKKKTVDVKPMPFTAHKPKGPRKT